MANLVKNLGIMGGTFDPIHFGHVGCAEVVASAFCLDEVWFMPANLPNFKQNQNVASTLHRTNMCKLAIGEHKNYKFKVSMMEADRDGVTYTSDTLEIIKKKNSDLNIFFITGTDAILDLPKWHNYEKLMDLATFVSVTRKGTNSISAAQRDFLQKNADKIKILKADVIEVSSSKLRKKIANKQDVSKYTFKSVIDYINENNLYSS